MGVKFQKNIVSFDVMMHLECHEVRVCCCFEVLRMLHFLK